MAQIDPSPTAPAERLPRRDLVILPLLVLATILGVVAPAEVIVRRAYPLVDLDACVSDLRGPVVHARPRCVSRTKTAEGPWVVNRYNECGYRTPESCGPKPAGARRIAMIGSSIAGGFLTPYPQTMAARTAAALAAACGKPVEAQNLGLAGNNGRSLAPSAEEALRLEPDVLVVTLTSHDLSADRLAAQRGAVRPWTRLASRLREAVDASRLVYMARSLVLADEQGYASLVHARQGADAAPAVSAGDLALLESRLAVIKRRAAERDVPVVLVFAPSREELVGARGAARRPDDVPAAIGEIARRQGLDFIDPLQTIPADVPSASLYYVVNHHMNGRGHAYLAAALTSRLRAAVPAFSCRAGAVARQAG